MIRLLFSAGALLALTTTIFGWLRKNLEEAMTQHAQEMTAHWEHLGLTAVHGPDLCTFGGLASMGFGRTRGPGLVLLTPQDLRVTRAGPGPAQEWVVPLGHITAVALSRNFLFDSSSPRHIVVTFVQNDTKDHIGFQVEGPAAWGQHIAQAAGVKLLDKLNP